MVSEMQFVIIATYTELEDTEARWHQPRVVFIDRGNLIKGTVS